jgi:hypothetical protein
MKLIAFAAALLVVGCASAPPPRPAALDPANPAAPESPPLVVEPLSTNGPLPPPKDQQPLPAPEEAHQHDAGTSPPGQQKGTPPQTAPPAGHEGHDHGAKPSEKPPQQHKHGGGAP